MVWGSRYSVLVVDDAKEVTRYGEQIVTLSDLYFVGVARKRYFASHDVEGFFAYPCKEVITATRCSLWAYL
jgi:hypothetical protein